MRTSNIKKVATALIVMLTVAFIHRGMCQNFAIIKEVVESPEADVIIKSKTYGAIATTWPGTTWELSNEAKPFTLVFCLNVPGENMSNFKSARLILNFDDNFTREIALQATNGRCISFLLTRSLRKQLKSDDHDFYRHLTTRSLTSIWVTRDNDLVDTGLISAGGIIGGTINFRDLVNSIKIE